MKLNAKGRCRAAGLFGDEGRIWYSASEGDAVDNFQCKVEGISIGIRLRIDAISKG
jgi:hypothetical protein